MRLLFLTRSYNSLTQRLHVELAARGHDIAIEFDIADNVTEEAVALWRPQVVLAPFLKRAIPASVWQQVPCLIVHPGIVGDRGPSALDWAIQSGETAWGVTVLQAEAELDAGPVWASRSFALRPAASKSSVYRTEVTEAAVAAVLDALAAMQSGAQPARVLPGAAGVHGSARPLLRQDDRAIDWAQDDTATVLRKLAAADGVPGVRDVLFGTPCHLFDARAAADADVAAAAQAQAARPAPGAVLARRQQAVLRATADGAVWIGHARRLDHDDSFKLPVGLAFASAVAALPELPGDNEIRYEEQGAGEGQGRVGVLHFDFYNGAMSTAQCVRLLAALDAAAARPTQVLVLAGGADFFSNGIHLNVIEAADSPADESMRNIEAMDDVCARLLTLTDRATVAALQGNAGAGGAFLAFCCDEVWARAGVLLNPHYKNMGNLYGSEYWTYTLPRRVTAGDPAAPMRNRLPLSAAQAQATGLVDRVLPAADFSAQVLAQAQHLARDSMLAARLTEKQARRVRDEAAKPLAAYRAEELARMRRNFYGFDSSYHVARSYFVRKTLPSWTPRHLAQHRGGTIPRDWRGG